MTDHERFRAIISSMGHGAIAELARRGGIDRRTIERKRDGRHVTAWDVWALERGRQIIEAERAGEPAADAAPDERAR